MSKVKKVIILCTESDEEFFPLSKVVPKELWPIQDRPVIQHILGEIKRSELNQVICILNPSKKQIPLYFKKDLKLEKFFKKQKGESFLMELKALEEFQKDISLSFIFQEDTFGDGSALLQVKSKVSKEPFAVVSSNHIIEAKTPVITQLLKIFKTCQRPVIGLSRILEGKTRGQIIVNVEKIANRLFKIKEIITKSTEEKVSPGLAAVGKYVFIPEIFDYLKNQEPNEQGEIILADVLKKVLADGKVIYGYEIEGNLLNIQDKISYLKSNFYLSLKHPQYGEELRKYLKEII